MMRKIHAIVMASSLLVILATPSAPVRADDFRLGVSDRVKIKVQEWPDLSGEYAVTPDGLVSLPLIGNIKASGLRLNDLAKEISDRLQQRSKGSERVLTAVEIAQHRPFAIMGDVQRPGEYPYRPGLTVVQAISIAGGYYRPEFGLLRLGRDATMATGDIRTQSARLNRLIAREARLSAAFDGREDIPMAPELVKLKDDPETSAILKNEQDALALENEVKRGELAALQSIKLLYEQEIETLHGHDQALAQEHDSIGTQLKELRAMAARGLALAPTMFSLERSLAQVASQQMATATSIVKANESIALAQQRVTDLQQERRRVVSKELDKTRDEIVEARTKIVTATQLLHEAQTSAPAEARERAAQDRERPSFIILRKGDGETIRELAADETTLVVPGDVIKIPRVPLPVDRGAYLSMSRADAPPDR